MAAIALACAAFARPPHPMTEDQAEAWIEANAPGWVYVRSDESLILSAKEGSVDDSAYPILHYWSRADFAEGPIAQMILRVEVDCEGSRYRRIGGTASDEIGATVDVPPETGWRSPPADSASGIIHSELCEAARKEPG